MTRLTTIIAEKQLQYQKEVDHLHYIEEYLKGIKNPTYDEWNVRDGQQILVDDLGKNLDLLKRIERR